jgi:NAD(P)H-quinone oxidoreductase subunit 5
MIHKFLDVIFHVDELATLVISLVVFIGLCVGSFARRYLKGDTKYHAFFTKLILLIVSVSIMISTNNLILLFISWCLSNALLVLLMIHKSRWQAAKASGLLALKNYLFGAVCIATAFTLFYSITGEVSVASLLKLHDNNESNLILPALIFLLIGAMTQSAIWPFHRWLISSLNSPTPVSAIMHAGLVNGGGLLLTRFAPLYLEHSHFLTTIFVVGMATALLGTFWKLMQSDVKRMLACSTMAQMGFMFAQIGLGLFPAAIAHLVWHGMFKAYLFLASGAAAQEKRFDLNYPPKPIAFSSALICGTIGSLGFAFATGKSWFSGDTTLVLLVVSFLSSSQFALSLLSRETLKNLVPTLLFTYIFGLIHGGSVQLIAWAMEPMQLMQPQTLNIFHMVGICALALAWLATFFNPIYKQMNKPSSWMLKLYVTALNASQPAPSTVTSHRNHYTHI